MSKTINSIRVQHKRDTSTNWAKAVNFVPLAGEIIVYSDLNKIKIGDGVTNVNELEFTDEDKVDKIVGKGLSTNDYTDAEKNKLSVIETGSQVNIPSTAGAKGWKWSAISYDDENQDLLLTPDSDFSNIAVNDRVSIKAGYSWNFFGTVSSIAGMGEIIYISYTVPRSQWPSNFKPENFVDSDSGYFWLPDKPEAGVFPIGEGALAVGVSNKANEQGAIVSGKNNLADGRYSAVFGTDNEGGYAALVQGQGNKATGLMTTALGLGNKAQGSHSFSAGESNTSKGINSITLGYGCLAQGDRSIAEGSSTSTYANKAHAEGHLSSAQGAASHAEGIGTITTGEASHAEGRNTRARAANAHAEGSDSEAKGNNSHAEGYQTIAEGYHSHSEGGNTLAKGNRSHVEGDHTTIQSGSHYSHAEGSYTEVKGNAYAAHVEGTYTVANKTNQHVQGQFNVEDTNGLYADIIGWGSGTASANRKNISALKTDGTLILKGSLTLGANDDSTGGVTITAAQLQALLALIPSQE